MQVYITNEHKTDNIYDIAYNTQHTTYNVI